MKKKLSLMVFLSLFVAKVMCEDVYSVKFTMNIVDGQGVASPDQTSFSGSAPITANVIVSVENSEGTEDTNTSFVGQWRVWKKDNGSISSPMIVRTDNPTEFYFNDGGTYYLAYVGTIYGDHLPGGYVEYDEQAALTEVFSVTAATSVLTFPNAFSPNGDGYNEIYKAKEVKSIIQFHATIYNRWGQRLYQWDNPQEGWDGTFNGRPVKDGVYYVQVKAKGADGTEYDIKKDVNLMRGYIDSSNSSY